MLMLSLSRVTGMVLLVVFAFAAVILFANRNYMLMAIGIATAAFGLALAFFSDDQMKSRRERRVDEELAEARAFRGGSLTVGIRWGGFTSVFVICTALAAATLYWLLPATVRDGKLLAAGGMVVASVMFVTSSLALFSLATASVRSGWLLHMDALGFFHCLLPQISWKHVHQIDLERLYVSSKTQWLLVLTLGPEFDPPVPGWSKRIEFLNWPAPKWDAKSRRLKVGLQLADDTPHKILEAARLIAYNASASRIHDIAHDVPVPAFIAHANAQQRAAEAKRTVDILTTKMMSLARRKDIDEAEVAKLDRELMAAMEEHGAASSDLVYAKLDAYVVPAKEPRVSPFLLYGLLTLIGLLLVARFTLGL